MQAGVTWTTNKLLNFDDNNHAAAAEDDHHDHHGSNISEGCHRLKNSFRKYGSRLALAAAAQQLSCGHSVQMQEQAGGQEFGRKVVHQEFLLQNTIETLNPKPDGDHSADRQYVYIYIYIYIYSEDGKVRPASRRMMLIGSKCLFDAARNKKNCLSCPHQRGPRQTGSAFAVSGLSADESWMRRDWPSLEHCNRMATRLQTCCWL